MQGREKPMKLLPPPPHQGMPCLLACLPLPPPCRYIRKETAIPRHTTSSSSSARTTLSMTVSIYLPPLLPRPPLPSFSSASRGGGRREGGMECRDGGRRIPGGGSLRDENLPIPCVRLQNNWATSAKCNDICTDCADFKGKRLGKSFPSFTTLHTYPPDALVPPSPPSPTKARQTS